MSMSVVRSWCPEGALGFSVLRIWPIFGSVFELKTAVFSFGVLCGLRVFSILVFGFRFLSTIKAVFRIPLSNAFCGFSRFDKGVTPCVRAKTVISRDLLTSLRLLPRLSFRGMHDKHSIRLKH